MTKIILPFIAILAMAYALLLQAQTPAPVRIPDEEAMQHVSKRVPPTYPIIARVAHVYGAVVIDASVSKEGNIGNVTLASGPPMLVQACIDAVKQWQYKPFVRDGQPVEAEVKITISFSLVDGDPEFTNFSHWQSKCESLVAEARYAEAASVCITAINLPVTSHLTPPPDLIELYRCEAQALLFQQEFPAALSYSQHELELAQSATQPDPLQLSSAYYDLARSLQGLGDLKKAHDHYEHAQRILNEARKQTDKDVYKKTMQSFLHDYAALLRQTGNNSSAEKAEHKASLLAQKQ